MKSLICDILYTAGIEIIDHLWCSKSCIWFLTKLAERLMVVQMKCQFEYVMLPAFNLKW